MTLPFDTKTIPIIQKVIFVLFEECLGSSLAAESNEYATGKSPIIITAGKTIHAFFHRRWSLKLVEKIC